MTAGHARAGFTGRSGPQPTPDHRPVRKLWELGVHCLPSAPCPPGQQRSLPERLAPGDSGGDGSPGWAAWTIRSAPGRAAV